MGLFDTLKGNAAAMKPEVAQEKFGRILASNESIQLAYKLVRDVIIFTNVRLITIDIQGWTGRKVTYKSIPYKAIREFEVESSGMFDADAELKIWTGKPEPVRIEFSAKTDVAAIQGVLIECMTGARR